MPRVVQTAPVRDDLLAIWSHIAEDDPDAADRLLDRIDEGCRLYATQPLMGQRRPDLHPSVRCFSVGMYVVFYRPIEDGVEVLLVAHGARDLPRVFRERFASD